MDTLKFRADVTYPLSTSSGRLKWYIDGVEKTNVRDSVSWTLTKNDLANYYNPHTYTLIITDFADETDTLQTTFGIAKAQTLPLTISAPTTPYDILLQSTIPSDFADKASAKGFEYRIIGTSAWTSIAANSSFSATPRLSNGKWEVRAFADTSTDCGRLYSEVKILHIQCDACQ